MALNLQSRGGKVCTKCKVWKADGEFYRHLRRGGGSYYIRSNCRECDLKATARRIENRKILPVIVKVDEVSSKPGSAASESCVGIIYTLSDPRDHRVRYVGKTVRALEVRLNEHRSNASLGKRTHLYCWMRELKRLSLEPVAADVGHYDNEATLNAAEVALIASHLANGDDLVNHVDGGEGTSGWKHTAEVKARIAAAISNRERRPLTEEQKRRISASRGGRIVVDENGVEYVSTNAAALALHVNSGAVSRSASSNGYYKAGGHTFRYAEQGV